MASSLNGFIYVYDMTKISLLDKYFFGEIGVFKTFLTMDDLFLYAIGRNKIIIIDW